ncbi:hypothetical protein PCASD_03201 [Puccinia coronata f. sp. avenae]|uniref:Uncharacterized protein n=1 Tax=Puccinia coronata f. sp. avenae TaxID=200324 RepID=A0A2N5VFF3_9BASI|nr:hypothetical protein PCASD_03201 [Puccinia coronata f. sp. avenae]
MSRSRGGLRSAACSRVAAREVEHAPLARVGGPPSGKGDFVELEESSGITVPEATANTTRATPDQLSQELFFDPGHHPGMLPSLGRLPWRTHTSPRHIRADP